MKPRQEVYDAYWQTAAERQEIFFKKFQRTNPPYTSDPIFRQFKFCNVYRASDRVSQFLIRDVIGKPSQTPEDGLFRILLFRLLNKLETWIALERDIGKISLKTFDRRSYARALKRIKLDNGVIYGNAFILCATKAFGFERKHENHLALLEHIFRSPRARSILSVHTMRELFDRLRALPLIGDFMAYQLTIDCMYSDFFDFDENDFTVAGPGAKRGIRKCFIDTKGKTDAEVIHCMVERQDAEFKRLGLRFRPLWGRPLHAIDCQGWFCELDKYARVKFPHYKSNRVRIKTTYAPNHDLISYVFPPKWKLFVTEMNR